MKSETSSGGDLYRCGPKELTLLGKVFFKSLKTTIPSLGKFMIISPERMIGN